MSPPNRRGTNVRVDLMGFEWIEPEGGGSSKGHSAEEEEEEDEEEDRSEEEVVFSAAGEKGRSGADEKTGTSSGVPGVENKRSSGGAGARVMVDGSPKSAARGEPGFGGDHGKSFGLPPPPAVPAFELQGDLHLIACAREGGEEEPQFDKFDMEEEDRSQFAGTWTTDIVRAAMHDSVGTTSEEEMTTLEQTDSSSGRPLTVLKPRGVYENMFGLFPPLGRLSSFLLRYAWEPFGSLGFIG